MVPGLQRLELVPPRLPLSFGLRLAKARASTAPPPSSSHWAQPAFASLAWVLGPRSRVYLAPRPEDRQHARIRKRSCCFVNRLIYYELNETLEKSPPRTRVGSGPPGRQKLVESCNTLAAPTLLYMQKSDLPRAERFKPKRTKVSRVYTVPAANETRPPVSGTPWMSSMARRWRCAPS